MLWEVEVRPAPGEVPRAAQRIAREASELGLARELGVEAAHGFLIQGNLNAEEVERLARDLLCDPVVEKYRVAPARDALWNSAPNAKLKHLVHVMPKPGVMDPVAQSTLQAIGDCGLTADAVRTFRKYWFTHLKDEALDQLCRKLLANDAIEQSIVGQLHFDKIELGSTYKFTLISVPIRQLDDEGLMQLSKTGQLYLQLAEMRTIRDYYKDLGRDPTDAELETLAQTWSEHCSHKTLAGRVHFRGPNGEEREFENMLKETIFAATMQIRKDLGDEDWCVSVFKDNAGIVRFDDEYNVVFKVETHNHPSALEPYGGANTGLGGVIRDPMGTGMGAKPICNTDVFCFAPPNTSPESLPQGVLHPRRVMNGVVSGVRDYGNRMGIPTVNGAICFDERYLGNPLVYCGNVGLIPRDKSFKEPKPNDLIVALGGRTGRDGIHGATFSSAALTSESESLSGGAVQIGNAITEKMVLDVLLQARDKNLYNAVTDCGAGGFSSAVGEMGADIGARVELDKIPLKYEGLSYTEMWISEAQERMIFAVPPEKWKEFHDLCAAEGVEAVSIGVYVPTNRLELVYHGERVADIDMHFLHDGRPPVVRPATYEPRGDSPLQWPAELPEPGSVLEKILGDLNVASKESVIRQYDHEVQAGSVIKPLVGVKDDGPSDAAVVRPVIRSHRGIVVSCGINPAYGDYDTYHMATSAIDEAMRNCVAVGADPSRVAILDNFCWGDCEKPETLGALVQSAIACQELAVAWKTPFISGKDSLNNEFRFTDESGKKQSIAIPHTLLISALGQVEDVRKCVTMDFKNAGNRICLIGATHNELAGSRLSKVLGAKGGNVPKVDVKSAPWTFAAVHKAIQGGHIAACHDLSDGGLAVSLAEMAFAGGFGASIALDTLPGSCHVQSFANIAQYALTLLFTESNSRFLCEVPEQHVAAVSKLFANVPHSWLGTVTTDPTLKIEITGTKSLSKEKPIQFSAPIADLKKAWQAPLKN